MRDNGPAMASPFGGDDVDLGPAYPGRALVRLAERIGRNIGRSIADRSACLGAITETAADVIGVERVGIWLYDDAHKRIECLDLFEVHAARHTQGIHLEAEQFPVYFQALEEERIIAAHDAEADPRTSEFTESYLRPTGIGAMLDAPIRVAGHMIGVICHENVGPARKWTTAEQSLAATMGDFVALSLESFERARVEAERTHLADRLSRARKMEALGRLAGSIAHDFNNLLTAILGSLDLVRHAERQGSIDPGLIHAEMDHIELASDRAASLVRQLLEFSRTEESPAPIRLNPVAALRRMEDALARLMRASVKLTMQLEDDTPCIDIDPEQFKQVILNLASNARDAMPNGGNLHIHTSAHRELNATPPHQHWFEMLVADSGEGIPDDALPLIFEPFYSTKMVGSGWGLGLATVQRVIEDAGGHIFVRSQLYAGTAFRIRLPAAPRAEIEPEPRAGFAADSPARLETVLLCEDEARVRQLMEETLSDRGYRVLATRDAAEAREQVRQHQGRIDLLLTDVLMPGTNGMQLAAELAGAQPGLRVLYISGYPESELRRNGIAAHGLPLIEKPFEPEKILNRVREALDS